MTGVVDQEGGRSVRVVVGVDTHQDKHVAVAIDRQGVRLGELHAPATMHGYQDLERWSRSLGEIHAFGIEGTGSYGAGVARQKGGCGVKRRQPSSRVKLDPHKVWELLNRLNMTQNELARLVGTSSGYLSQLMSGTRCPSADMRRRLMEALGVTRFEDLFILEAVE